MKTIISADFDIVKKYAIEFDIGDSTMSDGPYKSLPLRKSWRTVTEYAHKPAFTADECAKAMRAALHDDFKRDVPKAMMKAISVVMLDTAQGSLLPTLAHSELENIRQAHPASGLGDAIIEHTQLALHQGKTGSEALEAGCQQAAQDYARSNILSVEEHYRREPAQFQREQKTISVRQRLHDTLITGAVSAVGPEIVAMLGGQKIITRILKEVGLDAGPVTA